MIQILLATGCNERKLKRGSVTEVTGDKRGFFCIYIPILRIVTTRRAYLSFAFRPGHLSHVAAERPMRSPTLYRSTLNTGVKYREVHRVRVWDSTAEQNSSVEKNIIKEKKNTVWGHRMSHRKWNNNAVQPRAAHSADFPFPARHPMSPHYT